MWELIETKSIIDSDGFTTEYSWYKEKGTDNNHVMIFGDSEMYTPENTSPDAEFDSYETAKEWFDNYKGFDEDFDEKDPYSDYDDEIDLMEETEVSAFEKPSGESQILCELGENVDDDAEDKMVVYNDGVRGLCMTPESNYNAPITNSRLVQKVNTFDSFKEVVDYMVDFCGKDPSMFIDKTQVDESIEEGYGGAYDIEDDQLITREDLIEFEQTIEDKIGNDISAHAYFEPSENALHVYVNIPDMFDDYDIFVKGFGARKGNVNPKMIMNCVDECVNKINAEIEQYKKDCGLTENVSDNSFASYDDDFNDTMSDEYKDIDNSLTYCPRCHGERFNDNTGLCFDCGYDESAFGELNESLSYIYEVGTEGGDYIDTCETKSAAIRCIKNVFEGTNSESEYYKTCKLVVYKIPCNNSFPGNSQIVYEATYEDVFPNKLKEGILSKLKTIKNPKLTTCPICGNKLVKIKFCDGKKYPICPECNHLESGQWGNVFKKSDEDDKPLTEATPIILNPEQMNNPNDAPDFHKMAKDAYDKDVQLTRGAQAEEAWENIKSKFNFDASNEENLMNSLFKELVPASGKCKTKAGEMIRAFTKLEYRYFNDGDYFFYDYGIETAGSAATFLGENGCDTIDAVVNNCEDIFEVCGSPDCLKTNKVDSIYEKFLIDLRNEVIELLRNNPEWFVEDNTDDYLDREPTYEVSGNFSIEIGASDALYQLISDGHCDSWKLKDYVEGALWSINGHNSIEVERPWSQHDTSVILCGLNASQYEEIKNWEKDPDSFWQDLVDEIKQDLPEDEEEDEFDDEEEFDED